MPHRPRRQDGGGSAPHHREAARLVQLGGDLGDELVGRQADRDGQAGVGLDLLLQADQLEGRRPPFSRSVPDRSIQASSSDRVWTRGVSSPTAPKMRLARRGI
jgi:hypothetical protein